jgi:hypothetical protein
VIVIHQMAKVASQSWVQAAKTSAMFEGTAPVHCHFIVPANRKRIAAAYDVAEARRTIANMLLPRNMLRAGAAAWSRIGAATQAGDRIRVIAGIRDPVARSISLIVFMADFYGHVSRPLGPHAVMTADYVIEMLKQTWWDVLDCSEPKASFEWLLWYLTGAFRFWFREEFGVAYGVDLLEERDRTWEGICRIDTGATKILIYRAEDMKPAALGHSGLLTAASAFLEIPLGSFPNVNTSDTRRSRVLSEEIRARFRLPEDWLEAIYSEPIVRRFYRDAEIDAFKTRWRSGFGEK